jgi:hypothetical protein
VGQRLRQRVGRHCVQGEASRTGVLFCSGVYSVQKCLRRRRTLNNFSHFRWLPKYLRSRERHENRGWTSRVQTPLGKGRESFTFLTIHGIEFRKVGIMSSFVRLHPLTSRIRCDLKTIPA